MSRAVLVAAVFCSAASSEAAPWPSGPKQLRLDGGSSRSAGGVPRAAGGGVPLADGAEQLRPAALHATESTATSGQSSEMMPPEGSGSKKCMVIVCALLGSCCCVMPIAQNLAQMKDSTMTNVAGYVLSFVALVVPVFALLDVLLYSSLFSDQWKKGVSSLGTWCGILCLWAVVASGCAIIQLCHLAAYSMGKVGPLSLPT